MPVEIWTGVECSVIRVGDRIIDELTLTGHARRPADLGRIAALGITTLRYPALWERQPDPMAGRYDWHGLDQRLALAADLGLRPILGLLHLGTGRRGEMLDPEFPRAFGRYAAALARRYPWIDAYLPINEPMTTARFAGLYGVWAPHARDTRTFGPLVVAQALAYREAVRAIREVRPDALILATDDIGETFSTAEVAEQARFDKARRWLAFDALMGRVDRSHELRSWLVRACGVRSADLDDLAASPEAPTLLGLHYYPTSDRFLDHRLDRYPVWTHGGNGRQAYADVDLVRVLGEDRDGLREGVLGAWARYRHPMALTEVHLGGAALDRRAWWWWSVRTAHDLAANAVDVRAVTAWAAFGSWEWASLLTRVDGHYEPGLFDMRRRPPRRTLLAREAEMAVAGRPPRHVRPGWWQRPDRILYPAVDRVGRDLEPVRRRSVIAV